MSKVLVSVIIPTYNRANTICAAVDSVLAQTYPNIELIVVDDGSTDDTTDRLSRYGGRIRIVRQSNSGPAMARNKGAEVSGGDVIAFLDSDDIWLPEKIEKQMAVLERAGEHVPCCLCNAFVELPDGSRTTSFALAPLGIDREEGLFVNVTEVLVTRCVLFNQAAAIRRVAWKKAGGFDRRLRFMEDHALALQLSLLGPWAFTCEPLVVYHKGNTDALSEQARREQARLQEDMISIYARFACSDKITDRQTLWFIESNLRRARCRLRMAGRNGQGRVSLWHCRAVLGWEMLKLRFARRMPWYPRVKTLELMSQLRRGGQGEKGVTICRP